MNNIEFDIKFIKKVLPHRYPFLLVDRVLECRDDYVKALKNVTVNEEFFNGHFPVEPVMPGVLIIEAMAQVSCFMAYSQLKDTWSDDIHVLFRGIENLKFRKAVVPGDQLIIETKLVKRRGDYWNMEAVATVDGELACEGKMSAILKTGKDL